MTVAPESQLKHLTSGGALISDPEHIEVNVTTPFFDPDMTTVP